MASIFIKNLIIEAKHGVHPQEKQTAQRFRISVEVVMDTTRAGVSDDLADTIDWSTLRQTIIATVENNTFNLMERLAKEVGDQILLDQRLEKVLVSIDKLDAFQTGTPGIKLEVNRT
jgi:dihydroneopterin aldolase